MHSPKASFSYIILKSKPNDFCDPIGLCGNIACFSKAFSPLSVRKFLIISIQYIA